VQFPNDPGSGAFSNYDKIRYYQKFYEKRLRYGTTEFTVFDVELRRNEKFSVVSML